MRNIPLLVVLLVLLVGGAISHSHMGEKHDEKKSAEAKQPHGETSEHHGEMWEHDEMMEVLHDSMTQLGGYTDKIFHAIIHSSFSELAESARAIKKVAEGLEGTKPHKNIEDIDKYNNLVGELKEGCLDFERSVDGRDPMKIADHFGRVIGVCVECHINFRD